MSQAPRTGRVRHLLVPAILVLLFVFQLACSLEGIDYGEHWDEWYEVKVVSASLDTLSALPSSYYYGSLYFVPGRIAVILHDPAGLLEVVRYFRSSSGEAGADASRNLALAAWRANAKAYVSSDTFLTDCRRIFALLSAMSVFVFYRLGHSLRGARADGVVAAALAVGSWEINYHSRHIAVDNVYMLVAGIVALCLVRVATASDRSEKQRWLRRAGLAVGVAASAKFVALLLLLPTLACVFMPPRPDGIRSVVRAASSVIGWALLALYVLNPGLVLDPLRVIGDWSFGSGSYNHVHTYVHYVETWHAHLGRALLYLVDAFFGTRLGVVVCAAFLARGGLLLWRERQPVGVVLLLFVSLYLSILAFAHLFIVRNYLPLLPVVAAVIAHGMVETVRSLRGLRLVALAVLLITMLGQSAWNIVRAARTVESFDEARNLASVAGFVRDHAQSRILVSDSLLTALRASWPGQPPPNVLHGPGQHPDYVLLFATDIVRADWRLPDRDDIVKVFGTEEVNYRYYPTWRGRHQAQRVYLIRPDYANRIGFPL